MRLTTQKRRIPIGAWSLMFLWSLALGFWSFPTAHASQRPNFIIILADDMGYADASCYGNDRYQTPHLDALAREGMRFTDFHSNGPVCSPTRAALLTGRYQQRADIPGVVQANPQQNRHHGLQTAEITFAELLKDAGYVTGITGKWHLGYEKQYNPVHHGFDYFAGYVSGNVDFQSHVDGAGFLDWWQGAELKDEPGYTTHLITRHSVKFIEQNKDKPFCLYIAHEAPHYPYQGPGDPPIREIGKTGKETYTPEHLQRAYREMMQEMDKGIGEVIATVKKLGLAENTFVFFFSDNGATREGNNGPLNGFKGSLWEGGHRVPGIAWWPGKIKAGAVTDATAIGMDLMPTMLDLAGVKPPPGHKLDGISLRPALLEGKPLPERMLFWDYQGRQAVRQGAWKLMVGATPPERGKGKSASESAALYNLKDDLGENRNLADKYADKVSAMQKALKAWQEEVAQGATRQPER